MAMTRSAGTLVPAQIQRQLTGYRRFGQDVPRQAAIEHGLGIEAIFQRAVARCHARRVPVPGVLGHVAPLPELRVERPELAQRGVAQRRRHALRVEGGEVGLARQLVELRQRVGQRLERVAQSGVQVERLRVELHLAGLDA